MPPRSHRLLTCVHPKCQNKPLFATDTNEIFQIFLDTNCCSHLSWFYAKTRGRFHSSRFSSSSHTASVSGLKTIAREHLNSSGEKIPYFNVRSFKLLQVGSSGFNMLSNIISFDMRRSLQYWDIKSIWCSFLLASRNCCNVHLSSIGHLVALLSTFILVPHIYTLHWKGVNPI